MALNATLYRFAIDLSDMDRGVFESLDLRVARHPSESAAYMLVRLLAYCLEYRDGLEMTEGVSSGDLPAIVARDLSGRLTAWIEIGLPDAERLHRGSKLAEHVAVYTHRDARQLVTQLAGERIHRAGHIRLRGFDRTAVERLAERLERRMSFALSIAGGEVFLSLGDETATLSMTEHRLG